MDVSSLCKYSIDTCLLSQGLVKRSFVDCMLHAGLHPIRYFEAFPDVDPFGRREGYGNKAEWIVDLTTKADREGKHSNYANRYEQSELRRVNLKELDLQLDRGYRVSPHDVCCYACFSVIQAPVLQKHVRRWLLRPAGFHLMCADIAGQIGVLSLNLGSLPLGQAKP